MTTTSRISAATTVFACTISGGLLTLPKVFANTTLGISLIIVVLSALTTFASLLALVILSEINPNVTGYGSLIGERFGVKAKRTLDGTIGLFLTGVIGASFIVVHGFVEDQISDSFWISALVTISIAAVVVLLSMPKKMGALSLAATFSMVSFIFLVVTLMYYGILELSSSPNLSNSTAPKWWPDKNSMNLSGNKLWTQIGTAVPVILYAFGCQIQVFDIYESVGKKGTKNGVVHFIPVLIAAVSLMVVLFSATGIFGVYSFPDSDISGDVLQTLAKKGLLGKIARGVLVLACVLAAPLIIHPTRTCLASFMQVFHSTNMDSEHDKEMSNFARIVLTIIVVGSSTTLAISGINFLVVVGALGAFIASPLFFVIPGLMLLDGMKRYSKNNSSMVSLLNDGDMNTSQLSFNRNGSFATNIMAVWLVAVGVLTFVLSVWSFVSTK